jgi:metal-sulfur cluster biosynthetic enzyme
LVKFGDSQDGKEYQIKAENKDKFIEELKDLEDIEIELKFEKINISEDVKIKASDLINILEFIKVGD